MRRALRTPRAAAIAGVVFALLLTATLVLVRLAARSEPADTGQWLADPGRARPVMLALRLVPFAGIAFLWFIGVVHDRLGQHEDRFFATVFLGGGLLFAALLFVPGGVAAGLLAHAAAARTGPPAEAWELSRRIAAVVLHTYAMRIAAVFTIAIATIGFRTGFIPRWLGLSGYATALILLLVVDVTPWVELFFPLWILLLSADTLAESFRGTSPELR